MKRTYPANIDGQIFYIDEDAFELLNTYLEQLRLTFTGEEGREIVADIESRIRELFADRIACGANVIVLADVNNVIATMGTPEQLNAANSDATDSNTTPPPFNPAEPSYSFGHKKLFRSKRNKVFGGVMGGLAAYLGWNATIMRLIVVLFLIMTCFTKFVVIPFFILYLILWMVIPEANSPRQILEQDGEPLNVDTLGQAVIANSPTATVQTGENLFASVLSGIGKLIMLFSGIVCSCIAIALVVTFLCVLCGLIAYSVGSNPHIFSWLAHAHIDMIWQVLWCGVFGSVAGFIIFGMIAWGAFSVVFNFRGVPRVFVWSGITIAIMMAIVAGVLGIIAFAAV